MANRKIYFIREHFDESTRNGSIGNVDIEKILFRNNYIPLFFPLHFDFSLQAKMKRLFYLVRLLITLPENAIVIFQHPMYAAMNKFLVLQLSKRKNIDLICIIADINGLKWGNEDILKKEIRWFRQFKYFIVHNEKMQSWLESNVQAAGAVKLQFFDFLAKPLEIERINSFDIAFAGNLLKSLFLESLEKLAANSPLVRFHVYGHGVTPAMQSQSNSIYRGSFKPYELIPGSSPASFGLIWDGDGIDQPAGSMGHYMPYICHHKLSLYILCKLPVIVHSDAGSAELVTRFNIGFTINSLFDIEKKIHSLSDAQYQEMAKNTAALAARISTGANMQSALDQMIDIIQSERFSVISSR